MRIDLKKLLDKLGVDRVLSPYETQPWLLYDEGRGTTCSAEVRMGPTAEDLEAEIQFLYDEGFAPPPPEAPKKPARAEDYYLYDSPPPEEDTDETGSSGGMVSGGGPVQIMRMRALPHEALWSPKNLWVKGEDYVHKVSDWENKSCNFFRACIESMQMNIIPDIEEMIDTHLSDDDFWGGGRSGRIGRKSPKIKPGQLLGMKRGM